ncbi:MAG TPA: acyl-CoA carboxylase subunit epsilon [Glycomyces sp.]|nr:acyl-CoA carboxylase subunit epsilon [Glycomyces sp.]
MSTELDVPGGADPGGPAAASLRVLRGNPSDEELAALVGLIAALPREPEESETTARRRPAWTNPGLRLRVRRSWRETSVPARRGTER